jgi:hypothetical protein
MMFSIPAYSSDLSAFNGHSTDNNKRGIQVYSSTSVVGITGTGKNGQQIQGLIEVPQYGLSIQDREEIAKRCDAVFGVVTGRMQRIAGLEWSVQRESKQEDRIETWLKQCKQIYDEYANATSPRYIIIRFKMVQNILTKLPDCLPDMSNFNASLLRWKKRIEQMNDDASTEIEDWLHTPNAQDNFDDFIKKWVFDLLVHAGAAAYKEYKDGRLENFYPILGGSVQPLKPRFVGPERAYAQIVPGMDPKIYFPDEIMWSTYMPTSGLGNGLVPLEALVNKVAETLFFDQRAANMADGTVPTEKLAVFGGEKMPFGSLNGDEAPEIPLEKAEESRLETLLNEPRKNAIRVLSGYGTPAILDLTRSEIFKDQSERQRFIRESVAFVFGASNMEVNLSGSEQTSGRSTSEAQASIEREKGIYPIVKDIENDFNTQLIPFRFGSGYIFQYKSGLSEKEQAELDQAKMATGTYSINEVRLTRGDEPVSGEQYDQPGQSQGSQGMQPDGSKFNPLNVRSM